ncbi:MAG: GntR family transcriptional regulator [Treponema sp.]|jgi:GntR family transcriptional regulator|nr:GntR family transcriptional regulator [Treponema sp.]
MIDNSETGFNRTIPISLYYQLKEKLLKKIQTGEWKPGQKIPSESELCAAYGLSRITVRKAIEELVHSGRLERFQGRGTFITNTSFEQKLSKFYSFSEELKKWGKKEQADVLSFDIITPDDETAKKLGMEGGRAFRLERLRSVDGTAYTVETSYIPQNVCPKISREDIDKNGLYKSMRNFGVYPQRIIEKFRATAIQKNEAKKMGLRAGVPAIHLERTTYDDARIIEYCVSIVRGDFFTYTVEMKS